MKFLIDLPPSGFGNGGDDSLDSALVSSSNAVAKGAVVLCTSDTVLLGGFTHRKSNVSNVRVRAGADRF